MNLRRFKTSWLAALLLLLVSYGSSGAGEPELRPPPGARLPLDLSFLDDTGRPMTIGQALNGHPGVLVFADWTCSALCGLTLGQAAMALRDTHLRPGADYTFLAIGIDPRDGPRDAARMKSVHLADAPALSATSHFLSGDARTVRSATDAVGFGSVYLPDQDQFSHPAALLVLAPDGRLTRVLPGFMLDRDELREALLTALPSVSLAHRVLLICHAVLSGPRGAWVLDVLKIGGAATLLSMAGGLLVLQRRTRSR